MAEINETQANLALSTARQTEEMHLASTNQQIDEIEMNIRQSEANIRKYQDGIEAERNGIRNDRAERAKLKRKRLVFQRAAFALDLIEQED